MSSPISPRLIKGGLVVIDSTTGAVGRVIAFQYNPDTLTRSLQVQGVGEGASRSEALRLIAPAIETWKLDAEIDATDQLELSTAGSTAAQVGLLPQLAVLETLVTPSAAALRANNNRIGAGELEIVPVEAPLTLMVWSRERVAPVRITDFSVTEDAFDAALNPIRAKISLGLRVLSVADVGFKHRAGEIYMSYLDRKERLALREASASASTLGLSGLP